MNTNYPFRQWVPKPLGALILLLLFVPLFFSGGTYLSNINEMAGSMGTLTETFQFLSLCASIGMSMVFPFMLPYLQARNVKHVYLCGYALLALLNGVCAVTQCIPLLAVCCFLICSCMSRQHQPKPTKTTMPGQYSCRCFIATSFASCNSAITSRHGWSTSLHGRTHTCWS